jgi:energy-coupling factor transporter ATP-binding protein EcfA2
VTIDRRRRVITVCRSPQADPGLIPIFVEGNVLAHALTAEDLLTLHASAVEVGGSGLAILGPSGAGKSTLAAVFCGMGARLIADDVLRVDPTTSGAMCFPGTQGLRLRPAARSLGSGIEAAAVEETADGRTRVLPTRCVSAPLKLRAALVPELSREAERLEVTRLGARDGLTELLRHPRLAAWRAQEPIARLFRLTAEVAPTITVYRATVPWGSYFQPGFAEELLASIGNGATSGRAAAERDAALASDP